MAESKCRQWVSLWLHYAASSGLRLYSSQSAQVLRVYDNFAMYYFESYHYFYLLLLTFLRLRRRTLTRPPGKMRQVSGAEIPKALVFQSHKLSFFCIFFIKSHFVSKCLTSGIRVGP